MKKKIIIEKCDEINVSIQFRNICQILRNARIEKGITQKQIADASSLSKQMISKIECGDVNPTLSTLIKYCMCVGINLQEVLQYEYKKEDDKL